MHHTLSLYIEMFGRYALFYKQGNECLSTRPITSGKYTFWLYAIMVYCINGSYIVWEHWPDTPEWITWTNALQNRCYMCIQWTRFLYYVVLTWPSNATISQFNSPWNEFTSVWSMLVYNSCIACPDNMNVTALTFSWFREVMKL